MKRRRRLSIHQFLPKTQFWRRNHIFLREFRAFPHVVALALIFSILSATFEGLGIGLLLPFLQNLTNPESPAFRTGMAWLDIWILGIDANITSRLYRLTGVILITTWMRSGFTYWSAVYVERTQLHLIDRLRKRIFEQLQAMDLRFFVNTRSSNIINTLTTESERFKQAFGGMAFLLIRSLTAIVYFSALFLISWPLATIALLLFLGIAIGLTYLNARVKAAGCAMSVAYNRFTSIAMEFINGIRTIHAFSTQEVERRRYYQASSDIMRVSNQAVGALALIKPLGEAISTSMLLGLIAVAFSVLVVNGTLQVAGLLTFFFVLFRLVPILQEINAARASLIFLKGAADSIHYLLSSEDKTYFQNGTKQFTGLTTGINFLSVDFSYINDQPVLKDVTLGIERGKMTALVGSSGSGKTTLIDLVSRFFEPTSGSILVDGIDLCQYEINSWRRKLAIVSQDTFIFNDTIRNNIAYGSQDATDNDIIEAARLANALEFIERMPEGLETHLGDRGMRLSGGQRQRLAIARALLRDPEILILDEATSALDSVSERLIQESLEQLSVGRTVIAIAHRLSTIAQADNVIVLEQGQVVEQGSYEALLSQHGKLWSYHQMQYEMGRR